MEELGYIKVENVLPQGPIDETLKIIENISFESKDCFIETRNDKPKQLQNLHVYNKEHFITIVYDQYILPVVKREIDREPYLVKNVQMFQKWPKESGMTRPHQDDWYFQLNDETQFAVTCWIALDDVGETSGCLCYKDGSHKHGLLVHTPNTEGRWRIRSGVEGYAGYVDININDMMPMPVKKGDMLMHHGRTLHYAGPNESDNLRRALTFILFFEK